MLQGGPLGTLDPLERGPAAGKKGSLACRRSVLGSGGTAPWVVDEED